jgi:hypothetical protein
MATADTLMREQCRRRADAMLARVAHSQAAAASFAAVAGGSAPAFWSAFADVGSAHWTEVLTACLHWYDQQAVCFRARDPRGLAVVGPGLLALLDGWQQFAAELGVDPSWDWRPGADMVKRAADGARDDVVNFGHPALTPGQVAASLRRRLDAATAWWAGAASPAGA